MPGWDLYLHGNTCSLTALALFPSVLFHFVLSENNLKTIATSLPQKLQTLVLCRRNTSLALNWLGIQYRDYTKRNTETDTGSERLRLTQALLKTQNRAYSGRENNLQNGSRNVCDHFFPLQFLSAENLSIQRTPKWCEWTGLFPTSTETLPRRDVTVTHVTLMVHISQAHTDGQMCCC